MGLYRTVAEINAISAEKKHIFFTPLFKAPAEGLYHPWNFVAQKTRMTAVPDGEKV